MRSGVSTLLAMLLVIAGYAAAACADEGMWTYDHFPGTQMRAKYGWAPGAAWLRHWQFASIRLVQGCSASLVSSAGLVMTNHHCVRACLNDLGDAAHDYLVDGFYARNVGDERRCPALEANQLVQITNVTRQVQVATAGKSDRAFREAADRVDLFAGIVGFMQQQGGVREQGLANRCQLHAFRMTFEQRGAELFLQPLDRPAQSRLRHMENLRRATEATAFDNCRERMKLLKTKGHDCLGAEG